MNNGATGPTLARLDVPLDAHLHTDQSPDSDVPVDVYAALALERGVAELAITDHVDFDPRDPAWDFASFDDRERTVREAAARWADRGVAIRFGVELTYNRSWEDEIRSHLSRHAYDFTIGSVHDWPGSPYRGAEAVARWVAGHSLAEIVEPYVAEVTAAARSGLFDALGHLDVVKRYLLPYVTPADLRAAPELFEAPLRALVDSGTALEVNTSGLRQATAETYPSAPLVARFRELGGTRVTAGTDAHRRDTFGFGLPEGYRIAEDAGFDTIAFRRGDERVSLPIPKGLRALGAGA